MPEPETTKEKLKQIVENNSTQNGQPSAADTCPSQGATLHKEACFMSLFPDRTHSKGAENLHHGLQNFRPPHLHVLIIRAQTRPPPAPAPHSAMW